MKNEESDDLSALVEDFTENLCEEIVEKMITFWKQQGEIEVSIQMSLISSTYSKIIYNLITSFVGNVKEQTSLSFFKSCSIFFIDKLVCDIAYLKDMIKEEK